MQESKVQYKPRIFFGAENYKMEYAGFWLRVIATFIDSFVLTFILSTVFGFLAVFIAILVPTLFVTLGDKLQNFSADQNHMAHAIIVGVIGINAVSFILNWLYCAIFEASSYQATPGKLALDLKVTDMQGKKITFITASIRYWAKLPSTLIFCIGFLMAGWTEKKQCLHDMLADTVVIKK